MGSSPLPVFLRLMNETLAVASVAGAIVRKVGYTGNYEVVDKGVNDFQTKADRAAQQYIVSSLSKKFPSVFIVGEEPVGGKEENLQEILLGLKLDEAQLPASVQAMTLPESLKSVSENEFVIWVDPMDGTREFTEGLFQSVTVLIGLAVRGIPVGGVIHQPFYENKGEESTGRTIWGIPGVGFGGIEVKTPPGQDEMTIVTTRSHYSPKVESSLKLLKPKSVVRVGGSGHKVILLLEGKGNAYVYASQGCKKWDTCGPEAVLVAAGGKLTRMDGKTYDYGKDVQHVNEDGLLATAPGEDHDWYVRQSKLANTA